MKMVTKCLSYVFIGLLMVGIFIAQPANATLVGEWLLNEGTGATASDTSGYSNNGTISGASWTTDTPGSLGGHALQFDGVDDYVVIPDSASLSITDGITLSAWVKRDIASANLWRRIISKPHTSYASPWNDFALITNGASGVNSIELTLGGAHRIVYGTSAQGIGEWYHLVGTYDGSHMRIYVNGVEEKNLAISGSIADKDQNINIGRIGTNRNLFDGTIDEVRIYDAALSASKIYDDYNSVIPEPTSIMLLGTGLLGFAIFSRKKH